LLDSEDPFLGHNLDRLEKRFRERYTASLEKHQAREAESKPPHQTILKSMQENEKRLLMVRILRHQLLEEPLNLEL
jgi:hypothetical protein